MGVFSLIVPSFSTFSTSSSEENSRTSWVLSGSVHISRADGRLVAWRHHGRLLPLAVVVDVLMPRVAGSTMTRPSNTSCAAPAALCRRFRRRCLDHPPPDDVGVDPP